MENVTQTQRVAKENIALLSFKNVIVEDQDPKIIEKLNFAMRAGNGNHVKYKIDFQSSSGTKTVETTVWAVGEKYVCLKGGVWIPIANIRSIKSI